MSKRVVIKIGSSSLTGADAQGLNPNAVDKLVDAVATLKKSGAEVVIVSSGAIAAGLAPLGLSSRPKDLATQQAAASVGQGLLVHRYTESLARLRLLVATVMRIGAAVIDPGAVPEVRNRLRYWAEGDSAPPWNAT